jgi:zinc/manganese transport system permease protein
LISFDGVGELLGLPFVESALVACAVLGLVAGLLAPLIVARGMAFAVHGTAELAFTGGAAALLLGIGVQLGAVVGAVVAGLVFGLLGLRQRERDSVIGVVLAFGLGLGVLMLALYPGRASNKFGLLTGSIVSVDATNLGVLAGVAVLVVAVLAVLYRPLLFASADAEVAVARGVPVRALSLVFAVLIGLVTALAVPVVGAILVLSVMIAPGAAAARVTANPLVATVLAVAFAELALVGGTVLSLAPGLPCRVTSPPSRSPATWGAGSSHGRAAGRRHGPDPGPVSAGRCGGRCQLSGRRGGGARPRPARRPRPPRR